MNTSNINLELINMRLDRQRANNNCVQWINKQPDFQRDYTAWNDKMKTKFIETMLSGRVMNPIWTIYNPDDSSQEVLDGMHRITTAVDFLNNRFRLNGKFISSEENRTKYHRKFFNDLSPTDQNQIKLYNFMFNHLDPSYRTDINKRRDMWEILNRSTSTLNEFEFNKVVYNPFYEIITAYKEKFNIFLNKKDKRGVIETEIMGFIVLSEMMPDSWSSVNTLIDRYLKVTIGKTQDDVNQFLENNSLAIRNKLDFIIQVIQKLEKAQLFSTDKKTFNNRFMPYKFIICRLSFKCNGSLIMFNHYIDDMIEDLRNSITEVHDIHIKLGCASRNATFQKKLIGYIDSIIEKHINV